MKKSSYLCSVNHRNHLEIDAANALWWELNSDNDYDEYSTPNHRNKGSSCSLWRAGDIQCSKERVPFAGIHQRSREHVLQGYPSVEQVGGLLRPWTRLSAHFPEWHQVVLL